MAVYELSGKFVADGAIAVRGGRIFAAFKRPGEQRNTLHEVKIVGGTAQVVPLGMTPGNYFKDGNCALAFNDATNELLMFNTCSPNPATGGDAVPLIWTTGIVIAGVGGGGGSGVDQALRNALAALPK